MKDIKITETELKVLEAIWESGDGCRLTDIQQYLNKEKAWKNSTTCTLLTRMEKKDIISKVKEDVYLYSALIGRDDYVQFEMKKVNKLLKGDVKNMLAALCTMDNLTKEDMEEIDAFWQKKKEDIIDG